MPQNIIAKTLVEQLAEERRKVDFDSYDITVQQLLSMAKGNQINMAPSYQRQFRWLPNRQSLLIESIFLGIPVPNIFMATNIDGTWEVVDGVQRLSTLIHFAGDETTRKQIHLAEPLKIEELEKLSNLNGVVFENLPSTIQTQFMLRPLKVITLNDKSDLKVRFDLFERLNKGGVLLTNQEIRGCIYRGQFNDFLTRMASNAHFRKTAILSESEQADGTREEYVLRFFAFLHNYNGFQHSVVDFLNSYMESATKKFDYAANEMVFNKTFSELSRVLPKGIHRKTRLTPVNLYEAVAVGAALALQKKSTLPMTGHDWIVGAGMAKVTTGATNNRKTVVERIKLASKSWTNCGH